MTPDRFYYHRIKPGNYGMIKGFVLALFIHGVLFIVGGRLFVKPVQYGIQSANGSIDVDLVTALPQPDVDAVKSNTSTIEQRQEEVKITPQEEMVTLPQPDIDTVKSIESITEQHLETAKIALQEEQPPPPPPPPPSAIDAVKSIISTTEKQQEAVKIMPRPSQGTVKTIGKPGYFQNQPPEYPPLAKQMHQEGLVILMAEVDPKGLPVKVEVEQSSGYQLLDQAALKAVRRWRFQPERIGGMPMKSKVSIPVRFRLEE